MIELIIYYQIMLQLILLIKIVLLLEITAIMHASMKGENSLVNLLL